MRLFRLYASTPPATQALSHFGVSAAIRGEENFRPLVLCPRQWIRRAALQGPVRNAMKHGSDSVPRRSHGASASFAIKAKDAGAAAINLLLII